MTDNNNLQNLDDRNEKGVNATLEVLQDTLDTYLSTADVDSVYGEPYEKDGNVIIPAAEIVAGFGFGIGSGQGKDKDTAEQMGGSGGGGGGQIFSRPVAVIIASSEGVRIEPVVDITKIALAALTAGAFMLGTFLRIKKYNKIS